MTILNDVIEMNLSSTNNQDAVSFSYLKNGITPFTKTYGQIVAEAKIIAANLQNKLEVQSRVLVIYPPGLDFITSMLGCFYAGMIAVPTYPLQNARHAYRLHGIIDSCSPALILGTQKIIDELSKIDSLVIKLMATDTLLIASSQSDFKCNSIINGSTIAFLQYKHILYLVLHVVSYIFQLIYKNY